MSCLLVIIRSGKGEMDTKQVNGRTSFIGTKLFHVTLTAKLHGIAAILT